MDRKAKVAATGPAEVVVRVECVEQPDGSFMAHLERLSTTDDSHWAVSSDPQPTLMIALGQCISIAYINGELGV